MNSIKLHNGYSIPIIGYGTFPQKETLITNIPFAKSIGYKFIDSSDNYGNEEYAGQGLSATNTEDLIVVGKFSQPLRTSSLEPCFYESKARLNNTLDVYLLHWPYPYLWKKQWRQMEDLYLQGKCKAIGVCNFDTGYLKELLSFCRVKPMINQFEHHPLFQQRELVELCRKNDICVMAYSPLARMDADLHSNRVIVEMAEKYKKTTSQIILRWNIDTGCVPIPASSKEERIKQNFDIFDFKLAKEEIQQIDELDCGKRIRYNPRSRFSSNDERRFFKLSMKMGIKKLLRCLK